MCKNSKKYWSEILLPKIYKNQTAYVPTNHIIKKKYI